MGFYIDNTKIDENSRAASVVKINDIELPRDVVYSFNGSKMTAQSQILDGAVMFEKVTRKPLEINFEFTIRQKETLSNTLNRQVQTVWRFPLDETLKIFQNVFKPDQVVSIENNLINGLGIQEVIIDDVQIRTIRGNSDIQMTLKCIENMYLTKDQSNNPEQKGIEKDFSLLNVA